MYRLSLSASLRATWFAALGSLTLACLDQTIGSSAGASSSTGASTSPTGPGSGTSKASSSSGGEDAVSLTPAELTAAMSQSPLPDIPPDPTNAWADDEPAARLGQKFYFDRSIAGPISYTPNDLGKSGEVGKVSCADCHVAPWGTDTRSFPNALSLGTSWTTRNTTPITNVAFYDWFYWDGRADSLWQQALLAAENNLQQASDRLRITRVVYNKYRVEYEEVFGQELDARFDSAHLDAFPASGKPKPSPGAPNGVWESLPSADQDIITAAFVNWGKAIAAYERKLVSRNAPWDRFVAGDSNAISPDAIRGYKLFVGELYCVTCHSGPFFSDNKLHNIGVPNKGALMDNGLYDTLLKAINSDFRGDGSWSDDPIFGATKIATQPIFLTNPAGPPPEEARGMYRTKHLRQIAQTAPYMHNGSFGTLLDVVQLYNAGGGQSGIGTLDPAFLGHIPVEDEKLPLLVEFMKTLTGDPPDEQWLVDTSAP